MSDKGCHTERVDPFAEMSVEGLENYILRMYAQIAESRKCIADAKKLRQEAYRASLEGRVMMEDAEHNLKHAETMLAFRRGDEANVIPFPVEKGKEKVLGRGKKRA